MTQGLNAMANFFGFEDFEVMAALLGWSAGQVLLTLLLAWVTRRFLIANVIATMERAQFPDATVRGVIGLVLNWLTFLAADYYIMLSLGIQTTAFLGILTGSALAIGLAMQGTLSNVASGLMLLMLRPFVVGEYISGGGYDGTVVSLGIFYTTVDTIEQYRVSIPNSTLFGSAIINYSRNPVMTGRLVVSVAYDSDLDEAQAVLIAAGTQVAGVLQDPAPRIFVQNLAASSVDLEIRFSAKGEDIWAASRAYRKAAKEALDQAQIEIPFPQQTVHYRPVAPAAPNA